MTLFTIGFSGKGAEAFFSSLREARVRRLLDIRLNPSGQLSGFAKDRDLPFFLRELCSIEYCHLPILAPTKPLLDDYRKKAIDWPEYEQIYLLILNERNAATKIDPALLSDACLLCSEDDPRQCHRRLAAEYLATVHPLQVRHL